MYSAQGIENVRILSDEYANRIPNPEHTPKYTKVKVGATPDKQYISWAAL